MASGDKNGVAHLWDVATGNVLHTLNPKIDQGPGDGPGVSPLSFAPDGKKLLSSHPRWVIFWDTATGKEIRRLPNEPSRTLRYLPDGRTLIACDENTFHFLDLETGKPCRIFDGHGASVEVLAFSPDGKYIATNDCTKTTGGYRDDLA